MAKGRYQSFPLDKIKAPPDPARATLDPQRLGDLADSIAAEGLHQPVGLVLDAGGEGATLAWGHRRLLAHRLLQRELIDAKVFPAGTDLSLARWSENGQREDLNALEEAGEVRRFLERGMPRAQIARQFRRSEAWVSERLALLELPDDLQACIREHTLPLAVLRALRDVDNPSYRASLIRQGVTHGVTATVAEVWRAHYLSDRDRINRNEVTLEELAASRQEYVLKVGCDWCDEEHLVQDTRTWRLCNRCAAEVAEAKKGVMQIRRD
jgi:ParB/RepB/Spo0J family partition protein